MAEANRIWMDNLFEVCNEKELLLHKMEDNKKIITN
jgi:hypothetical protein